MAKKLVRLDGERKYKVQIVSQAIGLSEGTVSGYFNNQGVSVSDGLTAKQVAELVDYRYTCGRKFNDIDWDAVDSLIADLKALGWGVVDAKEEK